MQDVHEPRHAQKGDSVSYIESLHSYPVVAADTTLNLYCRNFRCFVTRWAARVIVQHFLWPDILFPVLLGYALLNTSRTAANDFFTK
jgi:hypothetical protein